MIKHESIIESDSPELVGASTVPYCTILELALPFLSDVVTASHLCVGHHRHPGRAQGAVGEGREGGRRATGDAGKNPVIFDALPWKLDETGHFL